MSTRILRRKRIDLQTTAIIGAGAAGLAAAIALAARGQRVVVLEKAPYPGGKMRRIAVEGDAIDAGPTVFTMKWAFDELFDRAGLSLDDFVTCRKAEVLARHWWPADGALDLFADPARSAQKIAAFSDDRNAAGYLRFVDDSAAIFRTLQRSYIAAVRPGPLDLVARIGPFALRDMLALRPLSTLWSALGDYFPDDRLRQLFARYATYCGSSPFLAPATLMLVAHVEQDGVWMVEGGMHALAMGLADAARRLGAEIRYDAQVVRIDADPDGVTGLTLAGGERVSADSVIFNGDVSALAGGELGKLDTGLPPVARRERSLSAVTWALRGDVGDYPLAHHNVFFCDDYRAEFDAIFAQGKMPNAPTAYICAQDRGDDGQLARGGGEERLFCLVNAPANGDENPYPEREVERCLQNTTAHLARCGLDLPMATAKVTTPADFHRLFPGTGGALYGRASHGWMASFRRSGARTRIPGLYMAGGSVHPGPGVPMAVISGSLAAESLVSDRGSMRRFRPAAISGGMLTE